MAAAGPRRVEAVVHAYTLCIPAWGHRRIWALTVDDGHRVSVSTVHRIMLERGLLHARRSQAECRELAKARQRCNRHTPYWNRSVSIP